MTRRTWITAATLILVAAGVVLVLMSVLGGRGSDVPVATPTPSPSSDPSEQSEGTDPSTTPSTTAGPTTAPPTPTATPEETSPSEEPGDEPGDQPGQQDPATSAPPTPATPADPAGPVLEPDPSLPDAVRTEVASQTEPVLDEALAGQVDIDPDTATAMPEDLEEVVSGAYRDEIDAERAEFEAEGWSRSGSYEIDTVEVLQVVDTDAEDSATVRACVDSSAVSVQREDGTAVELAPSSPRAWNVFELQRTGDDAPWTVTTRTFPNDPEC